MNLRYRWALFLIYVLLLSTVVILASLSEVRNSDYHFDQIFHLDAAGFFDVGVAPQSGRILRKFKADLSRAIQCKGPGKGLLSAAPLHAWFSSRCVEVGGDSVACYRGGHLVLASIAGSLFALWLVVGPLGVGFSVAMIAAWAISWNPSLIFISMMGWEQSASVFWIVIHLFSVMTLDWAYVSPFWVRKVDGWVRPILSFLAVAVFWIVIHLFSVMTCDWVYASPFWSRRVVGWVRPILSFLAVAVSGILMLAWHGSTMFVVPIIVFAYGVRGFKNRAFRWSAVAYSFAVLPGFLYLRHIGKYNHIYSGYYGGLGDRVLIPPYFKLGPAFDYFWGGLGWELVIPALVGVGILALRPTNLKYWLLPLFAFFHLLAIWIFWQYPHFQKCVHIIPALGFLGAFAWYRLYQLAPRAIKGVLCILLAGWAVLLPVRFNQSLFQRPEAWLANRNIYPDFDGSIGITQNKQTRKRLASIKRENLEIQVSRHNVEAILFLIASGIPFIKPAYWYDINDAKKRRAAVLVISHHEFNFKASEDPPDIAWNQLMSEYQDFPGTALHHLLVRKELVSTMTKE